MLRWRHGQTIHQACKPAKKAAEKGSKPAGAKTVETLNVLRPGKTYRVNAEKYQAAREAFLALMPTKPPGLTQAEMATAMRKAPLSASSLAPPRPGG